MNTVWGGPRKWRWSERQGGTRRISLSTHGMHLYAIPIRRRHRTYQYNREAPQKVQAGAMSSSPPSSVLLTPVSPIILLSQLPFGRPAEVLQKTTPAAGRPEARIAQLEAEIASLRAQLEFVDILRADALWVADGQWQRSRGHCAKAHPAPAHLQRGQGGAQALIGQVSMSGSVPTGMS